MSYKLDLTAELPAEKVREQRQDRRPQKLGVGLVLIAALATLVYRGKGPSVDALPGSLEFGSHPLQAAAPEQPLNIRNGGSADLHLKTALLGGEAAADFQVANADCLDRPVAPGQTCRVSLRFRPLAEGRRQAKLILVDDAGNSPQSVELSGTGVARPGLTITPLTVAFSEQLKGDVSDWQDVSLQNIGGEPLTVSAIELVDDTGTFALDPGLCLKAPLGAGEVCSVKVRFTPADAASYTARLVIRDSTGEAPHEIPLSGSGRELSAANARVAPSPLDFGMQPLEKTAMQSVSLVSTGNIPLRIGDIQISGEGADEFRADNNCAHKQLAPGQQCLVQIHFTPRAMGKHQARLMLRSDSGDNLPGVELLGYGSKPSTRPPPPPDHSGPPPPPAVTRIVVHPERYTFQRQEALSLSRPVTVTVTSTGDAPARVEKFYTQGASSAEFAVKDVDCAGRTLTANQECSLNVLFAPKSSGDDSPQRSAELVIEVANTAPGRVALSGTASAPPPPPAQTGFLVSPTDLDFGDLQIGQQGKPRTVTVTNPGPAALQVQAALPRNSQGDFRLVQTNCANWIVPARGSCMVALAFTPQRVGAAQTDLTVASATPVQAESVRLRGRALPEPTPATFALRPQEVGFGAWPVGEQSDARKIALINSGETAIPIHVAAQGTSRGDYRIVTGNCPNVSIPAHGGCELTMVFAPQDVGNRTATLTVSSASQTQSVFLGGTGLPKAAPARLIVKPTDLDFGQVLVGSQSSERQLAIGNPGDTPVAFRAALSSAEFRAVGSNCQNLTVPARGSCVIALAFAPRDAGRRQTELMLVWSSQQQAVRLSGAGVRKSAPPPPQTGWCCIQMKSSALYSRAPGYSLVQSTGTDCAQHGGKFFTDYQQATAACKAPPKPAPIGWLPRPEQLGEALLP
jgi:hypothetical protein